MKISVIICTYNREKYLYNVLKSIAQNSISKDSFEILVIDNNSTDNTKIVYEQFKNDFSQINSTYIFEQHQGLSYARNRGIKESHGEILIYVDDDALVNAEYLQNYLDFFEKNKNIYAAGGPIIPLYETQEPKWMSFYTKQLLTAYLYKGERIKPFKKSEFPGGGNAAYRKCIFDKTGFFNTELGRKGDNLASAEEKDIFDKMRSQNMQIFYLPKSILYHIIPQKKLEKPYFNKLTFAIGRSERLRTLNISKTKYLKRLIIEIIKWGATLFLFCGYMLKFAPQKGWKLILFRYNVTKGLLKK
ncbi:MAG: glycosyltransferase family 2 protein [Paludibacteraceae bacterium]|jgi:glycosyltransferase involved in cell wall biosynthesis|nr:glycosyltransferase family 2 protein [Paludibacteraceae bacterium]